MFEEKRPTVVSVIGWVWIILGSLMSLGGLGGVVVAIAIPGSEVFTPLLAPWAFWVLVALEVAAGILGVVAAIGFLRLRSWSRLPLELVTWFFLGVVLLTMVFMFGLEPGFSGFEALFALLPALMYGVPLVLMIRALRSQKVRDALASSA